MKDVVARSQRPLRHARLRLSHISASQLSCSYSFLVAGGVYLCIIRNRFSILQSDVVLDKWHFRFRFRLNSKSQIIQDKGICAAENSIGLLYPRNIPVWTPLCSENTPSIICFHWSIRNWRCQTMPLLTFLNILFIHRVTEIPVI